MADSRKVTVSKVKVGEYVDPHRPEEVWDQVEGVEVWYRDGRQGRGYYLDVSVWRERKSYYDSTEMQGRKIEVTSVMFGVGSSSVRELLEVVPRFNQKRLVYWRDAVQRGAFLPRDVQLQAMRARVREAQGLPAPEPEPEPARF